MVVTKIIRTVVIIIMCLFHDFSELDLTKVVDDQGRPQDEIQGRHQGRHPGRHRGFSIILWGLKVSWTQSAKSDLSCDQNARRTREIDATYATVA